jgi:hypothetical protein
VRERILLGILALTVALAAYLTLRPRPAVPLPASYIERRPRRATGALPSTAVAGEAAAAIKLHRNPFVYGGQTAPPVHTAAPVVRTPEPATPSPTPQANVKLVGIVHRDGVRAALNIEGTVTVLAVGESAEGYTLLAVDDAAGARLRTPEGRELVLAPPP